AAHRSGDHRLCAAIQGVVRGERRCVSAPCCTARLRNAFRSYHQYRNVTSNVSRKSSNSLCSVSGNSAAMPVWMHSLNLKRAPNAIVTLPCPDTNREPKFTRSSPSKLNGCDLPLDTYWIQFNSRNG